MSEVVKIGRNVVIAEEYLAPGTGPVSDAAKSWQYGWLRNFWVKM